MSRKNRTLMWWPLYALLPLTVGLLLLDTRLILPTWGHEIVEAGIVLLVFGLTARWISAHEPALMWHEAWNADSRTSRIIYEPELPPAEENGRGAGSSAGEASAPLPAHAGSWRIHHLQG
jgi:hypothetical protein